MLWLIPGNQRGKRGKTIKGKGKKGCYISRMPTLESLLGALYISSFNPENSNKIDTISTLYIRKLCLKVK